MSQPEFDARIQWHAPDAAFVAVLLRDGQPWFLDGALVGMGPSRAEALADLSGIAWYLVTHGENGLTGGPIDPADRDWLLRVMEQGEPAERQLGQQERQRWAAVLKGGERR